jgi:hypothetical protein
MEKGGSPWRQPWISGASCHVNLVSGHRYRGANPLLLQIGQLARSAELPFWCAVGEARRFGLFPRKGSKAAYVYRPAPRSKEVLWPDGSVTSCQPTAKTEPAPKSTPAVDDASVALTTSASPPGPAVGTLGRAGSRWLSFRFAVA